SGYLLSSRSSYSENAVLTEYFTKHSDFSVDYFTVTAMVQDGATTRVTSSTFKKEPTGERFEPAGCEVVRSPHGRPLEAVSGWEQLDRPHLQFLRLQKRKQFS